MIIGAFHLLAFTLLFSSVCYYCSNNEHDLYCGLLSTYCVSGSVIGQHLSSGQI